MIQASTPEPDEATRETESRSRNAAASDRNRAGKVEKRRQRVLRRMLIVPLLLALVLILVLVMVRDVQLKNGYRKAMQQLHRNISIYADENGRLPTAEDLAEFDWTHDISLGNIEYDNTRISLKASPKTILAHSGLIAFKLLQDQYAVLYLNGDVVWLSAEQFQQEWSQHEQKINRSALPQ